MLVTHQLYGIRGKALQSLLIILWHKEYDVNAWDKLRQYGIVKQLGLDRPSPLNFSTGCLNSLVKYTAVKRHGRWFNFYIHRHGVSR